MFHRIEDLSYLLKDIKAFRVSTGTESLPGVLQNQEEFLVFYRFRRPFAYSTDSEGLASRAFRSSGLYRVFQVLWSYTGPESLSELL